MTTAYLIAIWIHILMVCLWIGAMFFSDPQSTRFFSRLLEKIHGIGWYAQAVLWSTGLFMLNYHGISLGRLFSADFIASRWGQLMWLKIGLVLTLLVFQIIVGHRPSKLIYGYVLVASIIVGISVILVRPIIF